MQIKIKVSRIFLANDNFKKYKEDNPIKVYDGVDTFFVLPDNRNDGFFDILVSMAHEVEDSNYPYIILSDKEFKILRKYL